MSAAAAVTSQWDRALAAVEDPFAPIAGIDVGPFAGITHEKAMLFRVTMRGYLVRVAGTGIFPSNGTPQTYVVRDLTLPGDGWDSMGLGPFWMGYELRLCDPDRPQNGRHMGLCSVAELEVLEHTPRYVCSKCGRYRSRSDIHLHYYDTWPNEWWEVDRNNWPRMYETECLSHHLTGHCQ